MIESHLRKCTAGILPAVLKASCLQSEGGTHLATAAGTDGGTFVSSLLMCLLILTATFYEEQC
jgi:hypothetical protein